MYAKPGFQDFDRIKPAVNEYLKFDYYICYLHTDSK